jgi:hypothetical protein
MEPVGALSGMVCSDCAPGAEACATTRWALKPSTPPSRRMMMPRRGLLGLRILDASPVIEPKTILFGQAERILLQRD